MSEKKISKIIDIDNQIMNKYDLCSGVDMLKHKDEFIKALKNANIENITQKDYNKLEDMNYHTPLEIIIEAGMFKQNNQVN